MTPRSAAPSLDTLAIPEGGFDYFATEVHYRSLAARITTALGGFAVVVVTADPPPSGRMLSAALGEMATIHPAVGFSCEREPGRRDLLRFCRALPAAATSPLLVLDEADRLSDEQLGDIFGSIYPPTRLGERRNATARPDFLSQLEQSALGSWLAERLLVARLRLQELGADEVLAFIRHQLRPEAEDVFTNEIVTALAGVSGGDPLVVNQFSRRLLEIASTTTGNGLVTSAAGHVVVPTEGPVDEHGAAASLDRPPGQASTIIGFAPGLGARPSARIWRRISATLKLPVGIVFAVACGGVMTAFLTDHASEKIAGSATAAGEVSTTFPTGGSLTSGAVRPVADGVASAAPGSLPQ